MDSAESIVTALAAGAAVVLRPTVEQAVKDAYTALKALIQRKFNKVDVEQLETNPGSESRRGVVKEDIAAAEADQDSEVLQHALALLEAIQHQAPGTTSAIGVELKDIEGAALTIRRVSTIGTGVKVEQARMTGDVTIEDVDARGGGTLPN
jgi:hypothetical protein